MNLKERGFNRKTILKLLVVFAVVLAVLLVLYYFFLFTERCENQSCFNNYLVQCKRISWINDAEEATWLYTIKGKSGRTCEVEIKLLVIKKGKLDIGAAEGKSMVCSLPLDVMANPGSDLALCTGPLKEELQDLIIKKMHSYILENLGEISEELVRPI